MPLILSLLINWYECTVSNCEKDFGRAVDHSLRDIAFKQQEGARLPGAAASHQIMADG